VGTYILAQGSCKKVLFKEKKIKLQNKQHFVENKAEIKPCVLKME
jgi:hypothetical protein